MKKFQNKKGFTLVEMIVVLAIIAILIALLAPNVARLIKNAQKTADSANAKTILNASLTYGTEAIADGQTVPAVAPPPAGSGITVAPITVGTVTTNYYVATVDKTGGTPVENLYYDSSIAGTVVPKFMDGSGDSYLPKNAIKGRDKVDIYVSQEGTVMGVVVYDGNLKCKAVAGVSPFAMPAGKDFTTSDLRNMKYASGAAPAFS